MKIPQILVRLIILAAIISGGMLYKNHAAKVAQTEAEIGSLLENAKKSFSEMTAFYTQRIEILREVDPMMAKQIHSQISGLKLDTQEGIDQFDYFQNLVSEKLSTWLASPAAKKSPLVATLKELEIRLIRKRAEFHQLAFEANEKIMGSHSPSRPLAVFKAEKMLHEMESKPAAR